MNFKHIIVATDFSDDAKLACTYVNQHLTGTDQKVTLLHLAPDWQVPFTLYEFIPDPSLIDSYRTGLAAAATKRVQQAAGELFKGREITAIAKLSDRVVAEEIVDYAAEIGGDLIVVGSHGTGAIGTLVMGSVAQRIIRHAKCAVLVIPRGK